MSPNRKGSQWWRQTAATNTLVSIHYKFLTSFFFYLLPTVAKRCDSVASDSEAIADR